ncbi:hypothetical protein JCM8202v2_004308 [Rhodotorula sphaerocarpa]
MPALTNWQASSSSSDDGHSVAIGGNGVRTLRGRQLGTPALADGFATRYAPGPPTTTINPTGDTSSYQTTLDVWQYLILAFVVCLAASLIATWFIFRKKVKAARARRAARLAAEAAAPPHADSQAGSDYDSDDQYGDEDDLSTRAGSLTSSRRRAGSEYAVEFEEEEGEPRGNIVQMTELQPAHLIGGPAPPAYRERPRSLAGTDDSALAETATVPPAADDETAPTRPGPKPRSLPSRLSRLPSAIGSFLNKRVQPSLGGTFASTDELQTRAAQADLEASRQGQRQRSRRTSRSSWFSQRRATSDEAVPTTLASAPGDLPNGGDPARPDAEHPNAEILAQVRHIRRALSDAGLLVAPPRSLSGQRLSHGASAAAATPLAAAPRRHPDPYSAREPVHGDRASFLSAMYESRIQRRQEEIDEYEAEREIYRQERRARRRRRRERERQRQEDEAGLPTYSRQVARGDVVLQRADGWKSDEEGEGDDLDEAMSAGESELASPPLVYFRSSLSSHGR